MEGTNQSPDQTQQPQTPAGDSGLPFQNASRSDLVITSKGGQPVNQTPATPTPEPGNNNPTDATGAAQNNGANPATPPSGASNTQNGEPAAQTPVTTEGSDAQPAATAPEVKPDLIALFGEKSGGKINTPEEALALVDQVNTLTTQLAEKPKIEFPNEQAKLLYEYAVKFPGAEMSAAKDFLHVQGLPLDKMADKEKQFEAFALKRKDLTREEARQYFDEKYEDTYGGGKLEASTMRQLDHRQETQQAHQELLKMQQDFAAAQPSQQAGEQQNQLSEADKLEIRRQVEEVTKNFGGVKYQFDKNDANTTVAIAMDKSELQTFQSYLQDPGEFLKDLYAECLVGGQFSQAKFTDKMFKLKNVDKVAQTAFEQGVKYGELKMIKERKNTAAPLPVNGAPAPSKPEESYKDAWRNAAKAKQRV